MLYCALVCLLATVWQISADTFDTRVVTPVVQPPFQMFERGNSFTVQCNFPHPLIDCRVWLPSYNNKIQVADFSRGSQSPQQSFKDGTSDGFTVTYVGRGLSAGDCGVTLLEPDFGTSQLVECLGRAADGSWSRGTAMVRSTWHSMFASTTLTPRRIVVAPGSDVAVLLKSPVELDVCYLFTPVDGGVYFYRDGTTNNNRYRQHGRGLAQQECGQLVPNVQQRDAGVWTWWAWQRGGDWKFTAQATIVVVLSAPVGDPILEMSDLQSLRAGSILQASCRAPPSAPPANLTWLLDGHVVRRDQSNDTLLEDVASALPWQPQPVIQTFTYNLSTEDMGKRLECRMDHAALSSPKSVALVLPGSYTATTQSMPAPSAPTPSMPVPCAPTSCMPVPCAPTASMPAPCAPTTCVPAPTPAATAEAGCSALATTSVNASCTMKGIAIDCGVAPVSVETVASLACRQGYVPQINKPGARVTTCGDKKQWRPRPLACELDCGLRMERSYSLSVGENAAPTTEFPWHVAVYRKEYSSYKPICGGSLITLDYFISAAHCFWHESTMKPVNASEFKAAAGKTSFYWDMTKVQEQRRDVGAIHIPEHYQGRSTLYESDIAVVQLATPVTATMTVGVVCLDWMSLFQDQQQTHTNMGLVPGWGITASNIMSPTLRYMELPLVSYQECNSSLPSDSATFFPNDKFCFWYKNHLTSFCGGYSGGGFVFAAAKFSEVRYYIGGIVSHPPHATETSPSVCQAEQMTVFTRISSYVAWVHNIVFTDE